jgi:hypothetical protein
MGSLPKETLSAINKEKICICTNKVTGTNGTKQCKYVNLTSKKMLLGFLKVFIPTIDLQENQFRLKEKNRHGKYHQRNEDNKINAGYQSNNLGNYIKLLSSTMLLELHF